MLLKNWIEIDEDDYLNSVELSKTIKMKAKFLIFITVLKAQLAFSNPRVILVYKQLSKGNEKDKRLGQVCVKYFVFKTYDS